MECFPSFQGKRRPRGSREVSKDAARRVGYESAKKLSVVR